MRFFSYTDSDVTMTIHITYHYLYISNAHFCEGIWSL